MNKLWSMVVVCAVSLGAMAQVQNETPVKGSDSKVAEQAKQTVEREVAEEEEGDTDQDVFRPTEKINVDSSVSFPVDI